MKRKIGIVLCLVLGFYLFADGLTTEQQKIYNLQALSVQQRVETNSKSTGSAFSTSRYTSFALGSSESTSSIEWDAYQGANKISKAEFFRIAGYPDYEKICLDQIAKNEKNKKTGIGLIIGSSVGYIASFAYSIKHVDDENTFKWLAGAAVALVCCIPMGIGYNFVKNSNSEPDIATSFAIGVADIYNQELQASIRMNY